jgi:hypothetical protein
MTPKQLRAAARRTILRRFGRAGLRAILIRMREAQGRGRRQ